MGSSRARLRTTVRLTLPPDDISAAQVMHLNVQRMHRVLSLHNSIQQRVSAQESPIHHSALESTQIIEHGPEFVLESSGLLACEIIRMHGRASGCPFLDSRY